MSVAARSASAEITEHAVQRCYTDGTLEDDEPVICDLPAHSDGDHYDATQQIRWKALREPDDE